MGSGSVREGVLIRGSDGVARGDSGGGELIAEWVRSGLRSSGSEADEGTSLSRPVTAAIARGKPVTADGDGDGAREGRGRGVSGA